MSYNSGLTNVTGTVTSTAQNYTPTLIEGNANNSSVTLGTVGSGKKWRIISLALSTNATTGSTGYINLNGVTALECYPPTNQASNNSITFDKTQAPLLTAGQTVVVTAAANCAAAAQVVYIEESV